MPRVSRVSSERRVAVNTLTDSELGHLHTSLKLATAGLNTTDPNPRVGCVLVHGDQVISQGWHAYAGAPHAEVAALAAVAGANRQHLAQATAYVSLEPCAHQGRTPACATALIDAGVRRVVAAMTDPNPAVFGRGFAALEAAGIEVVRDALVEQATAINPGYCKRHRCGLPWVRVKMAASLDGRTATSSGESQWITGVDARADVQAWRARSSAIVTGSGTVIADNPALTVRDRQLAGDYPHSDDGIRQPMRVLLDRRGRIAPDAQVFQGAGPVQWWRAQKSDAPAGVQQKDGQWTLHDVLTSLAGEGLNEILVEAGAELAGAFVAADLVDELIVYLAPTFLGEDARSLLCLPLLAKLADRPRFQIADLRQIGEDIRIIIHPKEDS